MLIKISFDLTDEQIKGLEAYRKFLDLTRGVTYVDFQAMLDSLTKAYLISRAAEMQKLKREKVSKAYRFADQTKKDQVDEILEIDADE